MSSPTTCPNCGKSVKGLFGANLVAQSRTDFINKNLALSKDGYCTSCEPGLVARIAKEYTKQKSEIDNRLKQIIHFLPVTTSPAPVSWQYEIIGLVTAQTTAGTGFATELSRSWNDFFGTTSKASNEKIVQSTTRCTADLRVQCVRQGGNAVISTDIDFNEIGSGSTNMLMVCMAGTAIRVTNMEHFREATREYLAEIEELTGKLQAIAVMKAE